MRSEMIGIVACSGASNTGQFSDLVARKLVKSGKARMLCLARLAIDEVFAEKSKTEFTTLIVLDGCPINCAEKILQHRGITSFQHIHTTDFGIIKGQTPVTEEKVDEIVDHILRKIGTSMPNENNTKIGDLK